MSRLTSGHIATLALTFTAAAAFAPAYADITLEQRMSVEGAGIMRMANMTGTTTTYISGKRSRTENDLEMQSRLVRMFARDAGQTTEIVRLDEDKIYQLNPKKKEYTEISLAEQRAQMTKALEQAKQAQEKQPAPTGMDESQCEWSEPKVDVKKTGAKATIAGFDAEQTSINATQSCTDKKTGAVCDISLSLDEWLAPGFDGGQEANQFYQAYAQKMGLTPAGSRDTVERAEAMFGRYEGIWKQVATKMQGIKGYPVRTSFAMSFGGPECQTAQQASESLPPAPPAGSMGTAVATAAGQAAGETVASRAGGSAFGGVAGQIGGRIAGSLFKKRNQEKEAAAEPAATTPPPAQAGNNMITPLRITSELVSVKKDPIPAETFEVPAGFKKLASGT